MNMYTEMYAGKRETGRRRWRIVGAAAFLALLLVLRLTACSGAGVDEEFSPRLTDAAVLSWCDGTEEGQIVEVDLTFDREITVDPDETDCLRVTISGNRVRDFTLEAGDDSFSARLLLPTDAVTKGELSVRRAENANQISGILDADGRYAVRDFTLEAVIPSGVTLSTAESEPGRVIKSVDTYWAIRSIAWVGLTENGVLVPVAETSDLEMLAGYAAVHGHDFLIEDQAVIAGKIVEVLENNYSDEYVFSADGRQITAEKPGSSDVLDIVIYEDLTFDG